MLVLGPVQIHAERKLSREQCNHRTREVEAGESDLNTKILSHIKEDTLSGTVPPP